MVPNANLRQVRRADGEQGDCERKTKATRWAVLGSRFTIHCRVMRKTTSCALKRFPRTTSPKFTIMCANRAFLRTPEVELHGEHRVFPLSRDRGVRYREARSWHGKKAVVLTNHSLFSVRAKGLEPIRTRHQILSLAWLPITTRSQFPPEGS